MEKHHHELNSPGKIKRELSEVVNIKGISIYCGVLDHQHSFQIAGIHFHDRSDKIMAILSEADLAPVGISVYTRLDHFKQCIVALKKNDLSLHTELYIFSDAPRPGDEDAVQDVRAYAKSVEGFKTVSVIEREKNSRIDNNRGGMSYLLQKYGRLIWLEDDVVTAKGFLTFVNEALKKYQYDDSIMSITGYRPPLLLDVDDTNSDILLLPRFNAWGFGIWKRSYEKISEINSEILTKDFQRKVGILGDDLLHLFQKELLGELNALDIRATFWQNYYGCNTIYPKFSLTRNLGFDGTGAHCGTSDKFDVDELWSKRADFNFTQDVTINKKFETANFYFRRLTWYAKSKRNIRYFLRHLLYQNSN